MSWLRRLAWLALIVSLGMPPLVARLSGPTTTSVTTYDTLAEQLGSAGSGSSSDWLGGRHNSTNYTVEANQSAAHAG